MGNGHWSKVKDLGRLSRGGSGGGSVSTAHSQRSIGDPTRERHQPHVAMDEMASQLDILLT